MTWSWKLLAQILAGVGALGITGLTVFGADSASKPRPVHIAPVVHDRSASTSTTSTAPPAADLGSGSAGGFTGGSGGVGATSGGGAGTDTASGSVPATDSGPPPTVPESEFPVALPISGVIVMGAGVGVMAWSRRRRREGTPP